MLAFSAVFDKNVGISIGFIHVRTHGCRFFPARNGRSDLHPIRRTRQASGHLFLPQGQYTWLHFQAQQFRDLYGKFKKAHCEVVGISRDSIKSHENFKARFTLPFALLSDADETACELFGVIKQKNMYGKQVRGIERSTFVFDKDGVLRHEWRGVKADGHAQEVLDFITTLTQGT